MSWGNALACVKRGLVLVGRHFCARPDETYFLSRWIFLRGLGLIYFIAFLSLWSQIDGLVGHNGILPAANFLKAASAQIGTERYWLLPTLSWWNGSDAFLHFQCGAGVLLAVLVIAGVAPGLCLFTLWAIYLSLSTVCREFLGFQWDILLLETGFLAIFLAPRQWLPKFEREQPPSMIVLWLIRWLLFRLMFMSGAVKLLSGDELWRNLTALMVHYETQPLPTWVGWYAHQLPASMQKASCGIMFVIELAVPFLIFGNRVMRMIAGSAFLLLMVLISLTGNYCFFNLLTALLCLSLVDDRFLKRSFPKRMATATHPSSSRPTMWQIRTVGVSLLAVVIVSVSSLETVWRFREGKPMPQFAMRLLQWASPLRTVNSYGLFAVMTRPRPEIVIEGSNDGVNWMAYEFDWKPGDLKRAPGFVAPHQPRLDWQMWFAALGNVEGNQWFVNLMVRLLQGTPEVTSLLAKNPFPQKPPRYVRAVLYEYHFTDFKTRRETGQWWQRERKGMYCQEVSLQQQ